MNPTSSVSTTAGVTISSASLVPLVQWALDGFPRPIPHEVPYLIAAGIVIGSHALYNLIKAHAATKAMKP